MDNPNHWYPTNDIVAGDSIEFTEAVFSGSWRKPRFVGERTVRAKVVRESYGAAKQQHTFTLEVLESTGCDPLELGSTILRKGRNIYRSGVRRLKWEDETARQAVCEEKHERGRDARRARDDRRNEEMAS